MWGEAGNTFSGGLRVYNGSNQLLIESPLYSTSTTTAYIDSFLVANGTDTIWYNLSADAAFPSNSRPQIRMRVKSPPPSGYKIAMYSSGPTGRVHYWNVTELTSDVGNWGMSFSSLGGGTTAGDNQYGIGAPACTGSAISIAAYSSEYYIPSGLLVGGAQASFSSFGPLMNDSLKPDVAAPGVAVGSSISSFTDASYSTIATVDFNGRTYPFARFSGTSMSSPATAGVVGLVLDANPYLSSGQVKEIIIQTARQDDNTGPIPPHSTKWGWGKVNAYAAVKLALNTVGTGELTQTLDWNVYPNPATSSLTITTLIEHLDIQIIDMMGNVVMDKLSSNALISIDELSSGTYFVRFENGGKIEQRKFVKR
jgi:subtilisin family serine protease